MSIAGFRWSGVLHQKYSGNIASDLANLHFYWKQLFLLKRKKSVKSPLTAQTSGIFKKLRQISSTSLKIKPDSKRDNYYMLRSIAFWWKCFTNYATIKINNYPVSQSIVSYCIHWYWYSYPYLWEKAGRKDRRQVATVSFCFHLVCFKITVGLNAEVTTEQL